MAQNTGALETARAATLPDDTDAVKRVKANFLAAVEKCADAASRCGLSVIVEPLGPSVTNYLLTVKETAEFVRSIGRSNVFTMVDYRWEYEQGRPVSDLYENAPSDCSCTHRQPLIQTTGIQRRAKYKPFTTGFDYGEFLDFIKSESYLGALSIEANTFVDFEREAAEAIDFYLHYGIEPVRKGAI